MNTQNWEKEFDSIIGDIPQDRIMEHCGKEFCFYCGHPTRRDKTVLEIKSFISSLLSRERAAAYEQGRKDGAELATAVKDGCCDQKINIAKAELVVEMIEAVKKLEVTKKKGIMELFFADGKKEKVRVHKNMDYFYNQALIDTLSTLRTLAEKHNIKL